MKRDDGAYMTSGEMAETIERQAESIRQLSIERDNLVEKVMKLEGWRSEPGHPEYWDLPREGT